MALLKVKGLWLQREIGPDGHVGAVLDDGTPVALCSFPKWEDQGFGQENWDGTIFCPGVTTDFVFSHAARELKAGGLSLGTRLGTMSVPQELQHLVAPSIVPVTAKVLAFPNQVYAAIDLNRVRMMSDIEIKLQDGREVYLQRPTRLIVTLSSGEGQAFVPTELETLLVARVFQREVELLVAIERAEAAEARLAECAKDK
jgi:hypothetical protein